MKKSFLAIALVATLFASCGGSKSATDSIKIAVDQDGIPGELGLFLKPGAEATLKVDEADNSNLSMYVDFEVSEPEVLTDMRPCINSLSPYSGIGLKFKFFDADGIELQPCYFSEDELDSDGRESLIDYMRSDKKNFKLAIKISSLISPEDTKTFFEKVKSVSFTGSSLDCSSMADDDEYDFDDDVVEVEEPETTSYSAPASTSASASATASQSASDSSTADIDAFLNEYDNYVDKLIDAYRKIQNGDASVYAQLASLQSQLQSLASKGRTLNSQMNASQIARLNSIAAKAAAAMQ